MTKANMEIVEITNPEQWDEFVKAQSASFLQSWQWGEILRACGQKIIRLAVQENSETRCQTLVVIKPLLFGWNYGFSPRGPVVKSSELSVVSALLEYFKKNHLVFWRVEPEESNYFGHNVLKRVKDINPEATMVLDVTKSMAEILAGFHAKTRYNIKLAQKKELTLHQGKNFADFWQLMKQTGARDNFGLHPRKNYEAALTSDAVYQLTLKWQGAPAACGCFLAFNDTLYYLYGASDYDLRHLMAPYLIQWEGIKLAQSLGLKKYDFFGVAPGKLENGQYIFNNDHRYRGVTRFKQGFNGNYIFYPGTFDLILNATKYNIYSTLRWWRQRIKL